MIYKCYPHDRAHFATALRKDSHTGNLTWDNAPGQDVLIVQTAYGVDASKILEGLCNTLSDSVGCFLISVDGFILRYLYVRCVNTVVYILIL